MSKAGPGHNWVRRKAVRGGWFVRCSLCEIKRIYRASDTNYAEAERRSARLYDQHLNSVEHRKALRAYRDAWYSEVPEPTYSKEEALLRAILGEPEPTYDHLRHQQAMRAAADALRQIRSTSHEEAAPAWP